MATMDLHEQPIFSYSRKARRVRRRVGALVFMALALGLLFAALGANTGEALGPVIGLSLARLGGSASSIAVRSLYVLFVS